MSKFAGFLKRIKQAATIPMKIVRGINNIYKKIRPYVNPIIDAVPFGGLFNLAMDGSSKIMDITTKPLDKIQQSQEQKRYYDIRNGIKGILNEFKPNVINQGVIRSTNNGNRTYLNFNK